MSNSPIIQPDSSPFTFLKTPLKSPEIFEDIILSDHISDLNSHQNLPDPDLDNKKSNMLDITFPAKAKRSMTLNLKEPYLTKPSSAMNTQKSGTKKALSYRNDLLSTIFHKEAEDPTRIEKLKTLWSLRKQIESPCVSGRNNNIVSPKKQDTLLSSIARVREFIKGKKLLGNANLNGQTNLDSDKGAIGKHLFGRKLRHLQTMSLVPSHLIEKEQSDSSLKQLNGTFNLDKQCNVKEKKRMSNSVPKEYSADNVSSFMFFYKKFKNPTVRGKSCLRQASKGSDSFYQQNNQSFDNSAYSRPRKVTLSKIEEVVNRSFQSSRHGSPLIVAEQGGIKGKLDVIKKKSEGSGHTRGVEKKEYGKSVRRKVKNYPADGSFASLKNFLDNYGNQDSKMKKNA